MVRFLGMGVSGFDEGFDLLEEGGEVFGGFVLLVVFFGVGD